MWSISNVFYSPSAPPRGWERNAIPPPLLSPPQQVRFVCYDVMMCIVLLLIPPHLFVLMTLSKFVFFNYYINVKYACLCNLFIAWLCLQQSAEWCGPDGSVVLIRAVRSGLDRVVLELLRAGVPVNNADHTGNKVKPHLLYDVSSICLSGNDSLYCI